MLRRWLGMEVERSSVGDLAQRPLSERLRELEELFDAAVHELAAAGPENAGALRGAIDRELERERSVGMPFTIALLSTPDDDQQRWLDALRRSAEDGAVVLDGGDGLTAVVLPGIRAREADVTVDRLRAQAWSSTGCQGRLPAAGRASCPDDGHSADALL
ncbi:MAG TPA: hypothetical protein VJU79_08000, partial [Candidatus Dormibacteraeota bacterium]|nr:hypothetical protein [Candidatus Dormibacteraeota bacterium]